MPTPIEAYRQGFEKGRSDSAGGRLAEVTMGMLRDDPGGHFRHGYSEGAAGRPFNPPSISAPKRFQKNGLIPKFSDNPMSWFLAIFIVVELWTLWQLIKAPFQLIASLMRSEKPALSVIVKNVIVAGLAIALVWWVPHLSVPNTAVTATPIPFQQPVPNAEVTATPIPFQQLLIGQWNCRATTSRPGFSGYTATFLDDGTEIVDSEDGGSEFRYTVSGDKIESGLHNGSFDGRHLILYRGGDVPDFECSK